MSKIYAAKYTDGSTKTFDTWRECELNVKGVKGVVYKGFATEWEAQSWLDKNVIAFEDNNDVGLKIYVDGSFVNDVKAAGWAYVAVEDDKIVHEDFGIIQQCLESRNITGEVMASMMAIDWLVSTGRRAQLIHDYMGLSAWLTGDWKRETDIAKRYYVGYHRHIHLIDFVKIKGHQGNKWNEHVDKRAREGIDFFKKMVDGGHTIKLSELKKRAGVEDENSI
jgi:ribonuclease HI